MARLRKGIVLGILLLAAACRPDVFPQVTPTVAPTSTPTPEQTRIAEEPTPTPIVRLLPTLTNTAAPSDTPTPTFTPTATATPTDTLTPSATPTGTVPPTDPPTPTPTATATPTFTWTPSPTVTDTPPPTEPPTVTPLPLPDPSDTPTPVPTSTPEPSVTPTFTATPRPTATATATLTETLSREALATRNAQLLLTSEARRPSPTPPQPATPTVTVIPPTLDATPTIITATPDEADFNTVEASPVISTPQPQPAAPSATPTVLQPTPIPPPGQREPQLPALAPISPDNVDALRFDLSGTDFTFNGQALQYGVTLFAVNPVDPSSYARTDAFGLLRYKPIGVPQEGVMTDSPFYDGFQVASPEENKNYVSYLAWSPDGQQLAFIIDPPPGTDNISAGVWIWHPEEDVSGSRTTVALHDCPQPGYTSCNSVRGRPANYWKSMKLAWAPDSQRVLVNLLLPEENRRALAVVPSPRDPHFADEAPGIWRYDSGSWLDVNTILVSGRRPSDGRVIIGTVSRDFSNEQVLFDASAAGLWVQDAVRAPDGRIYALGKPGAPDGPLQLYDGNGSALTGPIGTAYPQDVYWTPDRRQVVLLVGDQQYLVTVSDRSVALVDPQAPVRLQG